jgi:hypothetical protein
LEFGICFTVKQIHEGAGRPAIEYWLNKQQALFITAKPDDQGGTTSASIGAASTSPPRNQYASGGRCRRSREGVLEGAAPKEMFNPWAPFINCYAYWNRLINPPFSQLIKMIHFRP